MIDTATAATLLLGFRWRPWGWLGDEVRSGRTGTFCVRERGEADRPTAVADIEGKVPCYDTTYFHGRYLAGPSLDSTDGARVHTPSRTRWRPPCVATCSGALSPVWLPSWLHLLVDYQASPVKTGTGLIRIIRADLRGTASTTRRPRVSGDSAACWLR